MVYFFQAGVPFSTENAKWTAFRKVYSEHKFFCDEHVMHITPSQILNVTNTIFQCHRHQLCQKIYNVHQTNHQTPSTPTKTPGTPNKTPSTPNKTPRTPNNLHSKILIYAVLSQDNFYRKFTHFFGVPFTGLNNMVVYQK